MATLILRPNAAGDLTQWDLGAGASNYEAVDETTHDDLTSYVEQTAESPEDDLYNIGTDSLLTGATINSITVYGWARSLKSGSGNCSVASLYFLAKPSGGSSDVGDSKTLTTSWAEYTQLWTNNPDDSQAWEKADIDALQVGIRSERADGTGSSKHTPQVTQIYVVVDYENAITQARTHIEDYRDDHYAIIHSGDGRINHTPYINDLVSDLETLGFTDIDDFFSQSSDMNAQELGYDDFNNYYADCFDENGDIISGKESVVSTYQGKWK